MVLPKVIVVEPNMNSSAHSEVNAGLLAIISKIYSSRYSLYFVGDRRHIINVENKISLDAYQKKYIKVLDYAPKFFLINEVLLIFRLLKLLFLSKRTDVIFLLGIMPISHIILSFFNILLKRKIILVLHGQIEALLPNTKIGKTKYYYKIAQFVFKMRDNLRYIVFGASISKNINYLFRDKGKIITIDQPYIYPELSPYEKKESSIVLGIIGRADSTKNIQAFYKFIEQIQSEIDAKKIKVKVVGKLSGIVPEKCIGKFSYFTEKIDDETMMKEIQTLDYALSFTDNSYYRAIPSGTFFDCIKWEIPILGLDNDFISYYFQEYGDIGKIFGTIEDMVSYIKDLEYQKQEEKKNQYSITFKKIKNDLSIENLKKKLETQL